MTSQYLLAVDEGSSSARAVLFDLSGAVVAESSAPVESKFPKPGWVELSPETMWEAARSSILRVLRNVGGTAKDILAVGVTSHRETIVAWDKQTGKPVHDAIMWMSKQTDQIIQRWSCQGHDEAIRESTGLVNDSFYSAGKIRWILENVPEAADLASRGRLAVGTPDCWLLWNLTGGRVHATDPSAASRTALFNLGRMEWDAELCEALDIPLSVLPDVLPSMGEFGRVSEDVLPGRPDRVPVMAVLGDQMAGLFGHACLSENTAKNTYGTAGVLTANVGSEPRILEGLSSSVAWQFGDRVAYDAEGVVFHSGQAIQWLRDRMGVLADTREAERIAWSVPDSDGVHFVPAFTGIGHPRWDRKMKASISGLTLETSSAHLVRAGVEAMAFQTRDNTDALLAGGIELPSLLVDGGATANSFLCQFQADILGIPVLRPTVVERTALGVAHIAGAAVGEWSLESVEERWVLDRAFEPRISEDEREAKYAGWRVAVDAAQMIARSG